MAAYSIAAPPASPALSPSTINAILPIDLPTALQLVDTNNPTVALARRRVDEASALEQQADVLWLPDVRGGPTYDRSDGQNQNSNGTIASVSKQSLFAGGGAALNWDTPEILFGRLVAERQTAAAQAGARATSSDVQLDVAIAYLELVRVRGAIAIYRNAEARAEEMLRNAEAADKAGLSKTAADINRARAEVDLRRNEGFRLEGQAGVASARLARLLLLRPDVSLTPADPRVLPIALVPETMTLNDLLATAVANRPELRQSRALVGAAAARLRQAQVGPFIPRVQVDYEGGTFGGGANSQMSDFGARSDGTVEAYWILHNLGAGDAAQVRTRQAQADEASIDASDVHSRIAEDVISAFHLVEANRASLQTAQQAVQQAAETWRRLSATSFGLAGAEHQYDPLQPLIALRDLAQAYREYLDVVIDYDTAEFRLFWALGQPPLDALSDMKPLPVLVPVIPPPYVPHEEIPRPPKAR
jgi:outer membrane protein TolC